MKNLKNVSKCLTFLGESREVKNVALKKYNKVKNFFDKYFIGYRGARADYALQRKSIRSQYRGSYFESERVQDFFEDFSCRYTSKVR